MLFKKTCMVGIGIFWNNMSLCDPLKQCADGSEVGGIGGSDGVDVTCDDGSAPVPPIVDPATGLCVAMLPGDTNPIYRGTEVLDNNHLHSVYDQLCPKQTPTGPGVAPPL